MKNDASIKATAIQLQAADPRSSVVLRASAGSGKTKVLVDRFLRLCIEDTSSRANPRSILAITFTKKAAVEIQQRLLKAARELALAEPDELLGLLQKLLGKEDIKETELDNAAGLFELLLEDLSGLNVGTIHSFCQLILGRFAAEAGLDPHFTVLEDNTDLVEEALDLLEEEISIDPKLSNAARLLGKDPSAVRGHLQEAHKQAMRLNRWLVAKSPAPADDQVLPIWNRADLLPALLTDLRAFMFPELPSDKEVTVLEFLPLVRDALERFLTEGLDQVHAEMGASLEKSMAGMTEKIKDQGLPLLGDLKTMIDEFSRPDPEDPDNLARTRRANDLLRDVALVLLTAKNTFRQFSRVKKEGLGEIYNSHVCEQALGLLNLLQLVTLLELYHLNAGLLTLMMRLLDIADDLKRRDRVIDFQDLEDLACRLLTDEGRALSLMHRLDDNLNHILLDEFQDTNFNQWEMLEPFVSEFLSGDHDGRGKTVFVVGDVKQSIYSFRAAEPELFGQVEDKLEKLGNTNLNLPTNFRSLRGVVESVGCVFNQPPLVGLYSPTESASAHQICFRTDPPGATVLIAPYAPEPEDQRSGDQLAADAAARLVRQLVDGKTQTLAENGKDDRDLRWGDILVLCRTRTEIGVYEKAFRAFNIPLMPAGRGMLAASREIQDVLALLRWLVYPADETALATVLRSPIFRFSEARFQKILAKRELHRQGKEGRTLAPFGLWPTLLRLIDDPEFGPTAQQLDKWRSHVGRENSHDLLRRIFREGRLLEKYQVAFDDQVRRNLIRLFDLALSPEVAGTPTVRHLSDVIARAARRGTEEEAIMPEEADNGRVRFMTIHGAKGLEAPVVLLVDADRKKRQRGGVLRLPSNTNSDPLLFRVKKEHTDGIGLENVGDVSLPENSLQLVNRQAERRDDVESANLLYVAMTRARDQLYILGADKARGKKHDSMMRQVQSAASAGDCTMISPDDPVGLDRPPVAPGQGAADETFLNQPMIDSAEESILLQHWDPPALGVRYKVETPSAMGSDAGHPHGETQTPEGGRQAAMERGNLVHLWLQLATDGGSLPPGQGPEHEEAAAVLANSDLEWVFKPELQGGRGLSEAPVIQRLVEKSEVRVTGTIDRLVLRKGRVDIIDYKTNRTRGDAAKLKDFCEIYRPQMESYRKVMAAMHKDCEVKTWLLFTDPDLSDQPGVAGQLVEVEPS
jgi:ATP-dependent helicase/nuclease subunit A